MKASELIKDIQHVVDNYGDIEVIVRRNISFDTSCYDYYEIHAIFAGSYINYDLRETESKKAIIVETIYAIGS
jgi:penicillin-binding protein-related factor A (putative recombinase)